jgi:predicted ribosome quality control (RQC) complex YloA/Tae2 family protein
MENLKRNQATLNLFHYPQIESLCKSLNILLKGFTLIDCLFKKPSHFLLVFKKNSTVQKLLVCFQQPFTRFHLVSESFEYEERHVHELLQELLSGMHLKSVETINADRIVQFQFTNGSRTLFFICEFFSKHPNCYLTDSDFNIFYSLHPSKSIVYRYPSSPIANQPSNRILNHKEMEKYYADLEEKHLFEEEKNRLEKELKKNLKNLYANHAKLNQSIEDCKNWESVQHEGDLIKANIHLFKKGQLSFTVQDWLTDQKYVIQVSPQSSPQEEMAKCYRRARKLQRGLIPLLDQQKKIALKIESVEKQLRELAEIDSLIELKKRSSQTSSSCKKTQLIKKQKKALPYHIFHSTSGMQIWVGKNAKSNEWLTFHAANGNDWWLHVQGSSGSHVIIKTRKGQAPNPDTLQDAMQLALLYSKSKDHGEAEICLTQKKYVSRLGQGKTGKVQVSQHTTHWIRLDNERCKRIKEQSL